ncbi:MAG: DUF87 domain-containing protein [Nitrospinota bacterium]|nr:MAG: DUF87 domain-containing protein [Nitrospinota bacterium]
MSIEIKQVSGDIVELIFNPKEADLRIGENLCILERESGQGIIVQVIEFKTVTYPSLIQEQLQLVVSGSSALPPSFVEPLTLNTLSENVPLKNLKIAIAKVRKLTGTPWNQWDGWIPTRDVIITKTEDEEVFANCIGDLGNPLHLGKTLSGRDFFIEGRTLEKINIITGVKGSGKSHLAKVILLQLIKHGAPAIVFDLNREYIHLPRHVIDEQTGEVISPGIIHLQAGRNLKLGVRQFGLAPLITMLTKFGLPEVSAMYVENRLSRLLEEMRIQEKRGIAAPFLGIEDLIRMAQNYEFSGSDVVNGAILSRLEAIRNTGVFASSPSEAVSLQDQYRLIREGGALVIDLSQLSNLARYGFVQAIIEIIREICEQEIAQKTDRFPFVFFEEAHLYINRNTIGYIVTRARHLGVTCFFVTNMVGGLDETVLRQVDNLFITRLPFDDDVKHIGKSALTDQQTMSSFVKRLRNHHSLVLGDATRQYPIIFEVDSLEGINTAGETQFFFKPQKGKATQQAAQPSLPLSWPAHGVTPPAKPSPTASPAATPEKSSPPSSSATEPFSQTLLSQIRQMWPHIIRQIGKKRKSLESILAEAQPTALRQGILTITFPASHRFQKELLETEEYRNLLLHELFLLFGVPLTIVCDISRKGVVKKRKE